LSGTNIPVGNSVTASTVLNLNSVNIPAGSLVATNIESIARASMASVVATVNIATNPNDCDVLFASETLGHACAGETLVSGTLYK
jgi:hypothetical protein